MNPNNCIYLPIDEYDCIYFTKEDNNNDLEILVRELINENSIEDSSVFELKYNNFSFKEIENLLDINYSQAEYRYKKLRLLLKKKIEDLFM